MHLHGRAVLHVGRIEVVVWQGQVLIPCLNLLGDLGQAVLKSGNEVLWFLLGEMFIRIAP